jgi:uncharacterized protein (TIGR04222 family)
MAQPWGLTGPEFTVIYLVGFPLSLVIVLVLQAMVSRIGSRRAGGEARLDIYEAAYVAGGPSRVLNTAVAGLALSGRILVASGGNVTVIRAGAPADPIEAAVWRFLRPSAFRMIVNQRARRDPACWRCAIPCGLRAC